MDTHNGALREGAVRLDGVWRGFKLTRERSWTLKETILRRRRAPPDEFWAVRDVSFAVEPGTNLGVIGVNGSGKSTLLKMIAGVLGPSSGTVATAGSVASLLDLGSGFGQEFTGRENVYLNGAMLGIPRREIRHRMDEIVAFSELGPFIDQPVRTYSSGMLLRLAFSIAVTVKAQILLLDEVLAVGDEAFQRKCLGRMFDHHESDTTIVFVSHDMAAVEMICDRVLLLEHGVVIADGDPVDVIGQYHEALTGHVPAPGDQNGFVEEAESAHGFSEALPAGTPPRGPRTRSWGTGRARITGLRLTNAEGGPTEAVLGGSPVNVVIDYAIEDEGLADPKVTVRVSALDGDVLFAVNSVVDGFDAPLARPRGTIALRIPRLPLHQGRFHLSAGLSTKAETEVFHLLERAVEFSVFAPTPGEGIVALERGWSLSGDRP